MPVELTFAMYRPKKGKEKELKKILKNHFPTLRRLGLITENSAHRVESKNGTVIEIFEWKNAAAKKKAHTHPDMRAIWGPMMDICDFPTMKNLPESESVFPNFKVVK